MSPDGVVLTNAHVVGKANKVDVVLHDGRKLRGQVVERAADNADLALVSVEVQKVPTLPLTGIADLRVGSWVASVGHSAGGIWSFNTGMVSNIYPDGVDKPVFQTQIPLNPGSSGGPVLDRQGRVVGIVTASRTDASSINFAIRIDLAFRTLSRLGSLCDCLRVSAPAGAPVFVDGKMVGAGPSVVVTLGRGKQEVFAVVQGRMCKKTVAFPEVREVALDDSK